MNALYVDGGLITPNPSKVGGTWAAAVVYDDPRDGNSESAFGIVTPDHYYREDLTNNIMELHAMVEGLKLLPDNWVGRVFSDSQVTLGRTFKGHRRENVPYFLSMALDEQIARLKNFQSLAIHCVLLSGHPTKEELKKGRDKQTGNQVSIYNVWCDKTCSALAKLYKSGVTSREAMMRVKMTNVIPSL